MYICVEQIYCTGFICSCLHRSLITNSITLRREVIYFLEIRKISKNLRNDCCDIIINVAMNSTTLWSLIWSFVLDFKSVTQNKQLLAVVVPQTKIFFLCFLFKHFIFKLITFRHINHSFSARVCITLKV